MPNPIIPNDAIDEFLTPGDALAQSDEISATPSTPSIGSSNSLKVVKHVLVYDKYLGFDKISGTPHIERTKDLMTQFAHWVLKFDTTSEALIPIVEWSDIKNELSKYDRIERLHFFTHGKGGQIALEKASSKVKFLHEFSKICLQGLNISGLQHMQFDGCRIASDITKMKDFIWGETHAPSFLVNRVRAFTWRRYIMVADQPLGISSIYDPDDTIIESNIRTFLNQLLNLELNNVNDGLTGYDLNGYSESDFYPSNSYVRLLVEWVKNNKSKTSAKIWPFIMFGTDHENDDFQSKIVVNRLALLPWGESEPLEVPKMRRSTIDDDSFNISNRFYNVLLLSDVVADLPVPY